MVNALLTEFQVACLSFYLFPFNLSQFLTESSQRLRTDGSSYLMLVHNRGDTARGQGGYRPSFVT